MRRLEANFKGLSQTDINDRGTFRNFYVNAFKDLASFALRRDDAIEAWQMLLSGPNKYEHLDLFFVFLYEENLDNFTQAEWTALLDLIQHVKPDFSDFNPSLLRNASRIEGFVKFAKKQIYVHSSSTTNSSLTSSIDPSLSSFFSLSDSPSHSVSSCRPSSTVSPHKAVKQLAPLNRGITSLAYSSLSSNLAPLALDFSSAPSSPSSSSSNSALRHSTNPFDPPSPLSSSLSTPFPPFCSLSSSSASSSTTTKSSLPSLVGLSNQGATCYMNSLLQSLFMTPVFRNTLYRWTYSKDRDKEEEKCIPYQLQLLFARLQSSTNFSIDTTQLTHSFGWTSADSFRQHDVQELCRVLFDAFECTLDPAQYRALVTDNYQGVCQDLVTCDPQNHQSKREDNFLDISLMVKDCDSLESAFAKFTETEILDGPNAYRCDKCNDKVNARKRTAFLKFPPLLTIVLKRFDLDLEAQPVRRVKLNHCVRFPFTLDVTRYLFEPPSSDPLYDLYSVLVHSGNAVGGHYFAFIKNGHNWLKFNDSFVTPATTADIEVCFGGGDSTTNAYMLLYRQHEGKTEKCFDEVPANLLARLQQLTTKEHNAVITESKEGFSVDVVYRHAAGKRRSGSKKSLCEQAHSSVSIRLEKDSTYQDLKNRVLETLDPHEVENLLYKGAVDMSRARLRKWFEFNKSLSDCYAEKMGELVWSAFGMIKVFFLEVLNPRALTFQHYSYSDTSVNVHELERGATEYSAPIEVRTLSHATIEEFKLIIQQVLGFPSVKQHLFIPGLDNQMEPLNSSNCFSFSQQKNVYVELLEEGEESRILQKHVGDKNKIKVTFNIPGPRIRHWSSFFTPQYDQSLLVDSGCTVGEFKLLLCEKFGLECEEIAISLGSSSFYMEPASLPDHNFLSDVYDKRVFVRRTLPLKPGEKLITFYLHQAGGEELTELLELAVDPSLLVGEIAAQLSEQLKTKASIDLPVKELRIRAVALDKASTVYPHKRKLSDCLPYYETQVKLAVQKGDPNVPADSLVCSVKRWYSATWTFSPPVEIFVAKGASCAELALIVASAVGIDDSASVMVVKQSTMMKTDPSQMRTLSWEKLASVNSNYSVEYMPLYLSDDCLIFARNCEEPIKEMTPAQMRALSTSVQSSTSDIFPGLDGPFVDVPKLSNSKDEGLKIRIHNDLSKKPSSE